MIIDRKYVIVAVVVGYISWTLLSDRIPAFRWIPYAFLAGFVVAVGGLLWLIVTTSKGVRYAENSGTVERRTAPAFVDASKWDEEKATLKAREEYRRPIIFPEAVAFSKAVDGLLSLLLRDYVTRWYQNISRRQLFQHEIDRSMRSVLLAVAARFTDLDVVEIGVARLLPIITAHMRDFYDAERAVRGKDLTSTVTESEELDMAIASKYRSGRIHPAIALASADTKAAQQEHLRALVGKLLPLLLPGNMKSSSAVLVVIREITTCAVLAPVMTLLADPDLWNQMVVNFGGPMLQDRKTVRKVREALDQNTLASPRATRALTFPRLGPYDSERQFERFIRAIRNVTNISDGRRFRNEITSQLRRDSAVEGQDAAYLRRLETGRRLLDQRIASLSADDAIETKSLARLSRSNGDTGTRKQKATLREVIYDAAGLSYFMEYMDRVKLTRLVQFYLVVDGFRGPLEGDNDEPPPGIDTDADRMDVGQMYENYLKLPEIKASEATIQVVQRFLKADVKATLEDYVAARQAVLQTQTQVYNRMREPHYDNFKRSDLYYKWLAIDEDPSSTAAQRKQIRGALMSGNATPRDASPSKPRQPPLPVSVKPPELRRAVLSTTDLTKALNRDPSNPEERRSLDSSGRPSLFEDDVEDERMTKSASNLRSYDSDTDNDQVQNEAKVVNAIQTALDNIVEHQHDGDSLFSDTTSRKSFENSEPRMSQDQGRPVLPTRASEPGKPSIASLGLVGAPSSRGVFVDDLFGSEAERFAEDEREDSNGPEDTDDEVVQEAAPGDLGLTEAIDVLNADIEKLNAQKNVLDSLTAKAELTNNTAELRILRKSEQSLQREIRRKEMQKQQYIVQESDNDLYGRAAVSIKSVMVGKEEDGHEFALYVIEVRKQASNSMPAATWAVTRRYSQFHELHKRLRARFPAVKTLEFPKRQALFTLQRDFIQKRRMILERYLRSLLLVPAICRSRELRAFLSQSAIASTNPSGSQVDSKDFVTRIYNSVSDGMEEFLGNVPVLDQLSVAGQNLISAASAQKNGTAIDGLDPTTQDPATAAEAEAELNAYEVKEAEPFVKPICDLFLEAFELSKGNSWLRGRAVVVVLHQLLGGTIERRVRESAKHALEDASLAQYVNILKDTMWPKGQKRVFQTLRTAAEKARTRKEASILLDALLSDLAGSVVGRSNAQAASRKFIAILNNQRLNSHLLFTMVDEVIRIVFPET